MTWLQGGYYILFGIIGIITLSGIIYKSSKEHKKNKQYSLKQKRNYWGKKLKQKNNTPSTIRYAKKRLKELK